MTESNAGRRALHGLLAVRLLGAAADGAMLPFLVLWAHRFAGLTGPAAGALFLAQAVGELVGGIAGGAIADRAGHRRALLVASTGMAVGYGSLSVIREPALAIAALVVAGLFESAFHPTLFALVGDLSEGQDARRAFSLLNVCANVGRVAGPLLGAAAVLLELPAVFLVAAAALAAAVVVTALLVPDDRVLSPEVSIEGPSDPAGTWRTLAGDRRLLGLIASGGILSVTLTWFEADGLVLLRDEHPLGSTAYAVLFALVAVTTAVFQLPVSRLSRDCPPGRLLLSGGCLQGLGLGLLSFGTHGYAPLVLGVTVLAVGAMLYGPAISTFVNDRAPRDRRATYQAAISTTEDIGGALGPTSGLALAGIDAGRLVWLVAAPLCLLAATASARAAKPTPRVATC